ncbi:hypothetical protein [Virgibacillus dakarensis]|uniref:hypothetical protein n=1 Tax=Virgibacillus dakarensis TaxID=1917889 RepID=UPI000B44F35D|nr:hypothetical protein [Virgibacillus dakarensis]
MEQETVLNEILHELRRHSGQMNEKMDNMKNELESKMGTMIKELDSKMDKGFDRLGKKVDGIRVELTETQETTDYLLSKTAQHEKKLRQFS